MKFAAFLVPLGFASLAFSMDERLPIPAQKVEADVGYALYSLDGIYDGNGVNYSTSSSQFTDAFPLQIKYGILPGLDVEARWDAVLIPHVKFGEAQPGLNGIGPSGAPKADAFLGGMARPELGLKYALPKCGVGAFVNERFPFATGSYGRPDPAAATDFGVLYGNRFRPFRLTGMVFYTYNTHKSGYYKDSSGAPYPFSYHYPTTLTLYAKPEYITKKSLGLYLGARYTTNVGKRQIDGEAFEDRENSLLLIPGMDIPGRKGIAYEIAVPFVAHGKDTYSYLGISASAYLTFPDLSEKKKRIL